MNRVIPIAIIGLLITFAAVAPAAATEHLAHTTTTTVSGATLASELLHQIRIVEVGSGGVTMTVETSAGTNEIVVDYTHLVGANDGASGSSNSGELLSWAALAVIGGGLLRVIQTLIRLGG